MADSAYLSNEKQSNQFSLFDKVFTMPDITYKTHQHETGLNTNETPQWRQKGSNKNMFRNLET